MLQNLTIMKKTVLSIFTLAVFATILTSSSGGRTDGRSGSPGDANQDCGQCHGPSTASSTSMIATDIPASGYVGGSTYNVTVSVAETGASMFGFQITAEHSSNAKAGTFATGGNSEIYTVTAGHAVTHNTAGTFGTDSKSWTMTWTAPSSGSGDVTFYVAGNGANGTGDTTGDVIYTDSQAAAEDVANGIAINEFANADVNIYPNPTSDYFTIKGVDKRATITLFDLKGSEVKSFANSVNQFDVSELEQGTYLLYISVDGVPNIEKLIIQ